MIGKAAKTTSVFLNVFCSATIVNAIKARRTQSLWLIALRNIGCADAAASLLTLQRSMLVSFEGMNNRDMEIMNALTGAGVCLLTAALGIYMILKKAKPVKADA